MIREHKALQQRISSLESKQQSKFITLYDDEPAPPGVSPDRIVRLSSEDLKLL